MIKKLPKENGMSGSFDAMNQEDIYQLESITAADKAQAVPYVKMWEIRLSDGKPVHPSPFNDSEPAYPLTLWTAVPPKFGNSVDTTAELRERPDVSLESVTIKSVNPSGLILFKQLEISFVVHNPEALEYGMDTRLSSMKGNVDTWASLITPGSIIALEYGWSANSMHVKNPILNGEDGRNPKKIIRFAVTNYTFTILQNQEIKINVTGFENGEYIFRHTYVVPGIRPEKDYDDENLVKTVDREAFFKQFKKQAEIVQNKFKSRVNKKARGTKWGRVIRVEDIFDIFFVAEAEPSILGLGFKGVEFYMGYCNPKCPKPKGKNMWVNDTLYIGDFTIPVDTVVETMANMIDNGIELTIYNFITPFFREFNKADSWEDNVDLVMPEVQMKMRIEQGVVKIYVIDVKHELMRFTDNDRDSFLEWQEKNTKGTTSRANRDEVRKRVIEKKVPYIEMMKANSYIQDAQFDIVQDEMMQAIFITRTYAGNKFDVVGDNSGRTLLDNNIQGSKALYSSAIKGQITMIGNHAVDVFGLYFIDFGVSVWSGTFRVLDTTHVIEMGGWRTTISVISDGVDPLGTQRGKKPKAAVQKAAVDKLRFKSKLTSQEQKQLNDLDKLLKGNLFTSTK